ncbi:survival motor neuron protein-like isoform X5 [Oncorhynchus keta]|uniref:survival motor neuron protein-like isoform X5 n=1 Tax=Oncorhynchus keta TaxID=8018 RepID=UPI0015FA8F11|nr:survival motor neuron protein-like isoform X5 [Oncorhynchus keta]
MDEYYESIVFRSERVEDNVSLAVATDDSALVNAYEEALRTFRSCNDEKESKEKLGNNPPKLTDSKLPRSHVLSKEPVEPKANSKVWRLGYRCRAVYSEDGLVYPAVLVWLRGERCRVKFEGYGNEEELELSSLLSPVELGGHRGRVDAKVQQGAVDGFSSTSNNIADWKRMERDWRTAQQEGREELSSPQPPKFAPGKDYCKSSYDFGKEHGDKKKPSGQREDFLPPPPPPRPPCVWPPRAVLADVSDGLDSAVTDLSSMLLSWYLCGYHTGCYMAMQQTKTSRRRADKEKQAEE